MRQLPALPGQFEPNRSNGVVRQITNAPSRREVDGIAVVTTNVDLAKTRFESAGATGIPTPIKGCVRDRGDDVGLSAKGGPGRAVGGFSVEEPVTIDAVKAAVEDRHALPNGDIVPTGLLLVAAVRTARRIPENGD
jgi:hypothetical protein